MIRQLLAALLVTFGVIALTSTAHAAPKLPEPKIYAVYFSAAFCPNCKILGPELAKARAELDDTDVLFVTLDYTDKPSIHQSLMLAQAIGIDAFVQAQGAGTGYVALLTADKKTELTRFDRTSDAAGIIKIVEAQLPK